MIVFVLILLERFKRLMIIRTFIYLLYISNNSFLTSSFIPNASVLIPSGTNMILLLSLELSATLCIRCVYT